MNPLLSYGRRKCKYYNRKEGMAMMKHIHRAMIALVVILAVTIMTIANDPLIDVIVCLFIGTPLAFLWSNKKDKK